MHLLAALIEHLIPLRVGEVLVVVVAVVINRVPQVLLQVLPVSLATSAAVAIFA